MHKEQRKSLEQALSKVITDWVDFLGKDAGEKMEKSIRAAARDLMKKWSKMEKKQLGKEQSAELSHDAEELALSVPVKLNVRKVVRKTLKPAGKTGSAKPAKAASNKGGEIKTKKAKGTARVGMKAPAKKAAVKGSVKKVTGKAK